MSLFIFWMSVFFVQRQLFLLFNIGEVKLLPWQEVLLSNWHALSNDISATAYLIALPFFIITLTLAIRKRVNSIKIVHAINIILLSVSILIGFIDIGLSLQWGTKLNSMALTYVDTSAEFSSLIFTSSNTLLFLAFCVLLSVCLYIYHKIFTHRTLTVTSWKSHTAITLLLFSILMVSARGGLGKFPLDRSRAFYSANPVLNNAALNGDWNLADLIVQPNKPANPYQFLSLEKATEIQQKLFHRPPDSTKNVLTIRHPNIVLIIMESMGADVFSCLNGEKGITPGMDSLAAKGLLFTNIYAAGTRTDHGLLALFSGYPAIPQETIIRDFDRIENISHINRNLTKAGYHTSYIIGGNLDYANTRSYMLTGKTRLLADHNDFAVIKKTSWGAYDEELFAEHIKLAASFPQPFFSALSTITNHEDFDAKVPRVYRSKLTVDRFRNTAHYTDQCVAGYLRMASTQPWYKNTLFVLVADHAHSYPLKRKYNEPGRYHIPLILYGEVLKPEFRGRKETHTGSQYDLPYTLFTQMGLETSDFIWGKDILNAASPEFAWYAFDHGFGFITPGGYVVYDHNLKKTVMHDKRLNSSQIELLNEEGKAFLQLLFQDYRETGNRLPAKSR